MTTTWVDPYGTPVDRGETTGVDLIEVLGLVPYHGFNRPVQRYGPTVAVIRTPADWFGPETLEPTCQT